MAEGLFVNVMQAEEQDYYVYCWKLKELLMDFILNCFYNSVCFMKHSKTNLNL